MSKTSGIKTTKDGNKSVKSQCKQKFQWNQCVKCGLILGKHQNDEHQCFSIENPIELSHSIVSNNFSLLNGVEHSKEILKDLQLSKEYLFDVAFLNPSTMKLASLKLGDLIIISNSIESWVNDSLGLVASCWPSAQVQPDQISLNKLNLTSNCLKLDEDTKLFIQKIDTKIPSLTKLNIEFSRLNFKIEPNEVDLVLSFLKEICMFKTVWRDQVIGLSYMGRRVLFRVLGGEVERAKTRKPTNEVIPTEVLDKFNSALNLNENTNLKKDFQDSDFKPVTLNSIFFTEENKNLFTRLEEKSKKFISELFKISPETTFCLGADSSQIESDLEVEVGEKVSLNDIGALDKEIKLLKDFFINPFEFSDLYAEVGVEVSKGVLLYGPSGCGKTVLAKAIRNEIKTNFVELKISEIYSKNYGETESRLRSFFTNVWSKSPCVVMIDELDTLCGRRENLNQELEKRILTLFINMLDESKSKKILFLCTTNKIDTIDLSLRRPGRLDKEVEVPIPNQAGRHQILRKKLSKFNHAISDEEVLEIAQNCHGYVGADLELLVQEAGLSCVKRLMDSNKKRSDGESKINFDDLLGALKKVRPSAMREITFDIPKVYWSEIGGQHELKQKLQQAVVWPIKYAESFKRLNIKPPRGLLMYGPPGCSKTMIAKALATETGLNFIAVKIKMKKGPELFSKWVGESERMVREIFRKARNAAPAIIFFDEIDAVAMERSSSANKSNNVGDRVLAQLLNEMDGVENLNEVTIVAATNRPDMIDKALMRPGRLDRIVYVSLPDKQTRREIFELKFKKMPCSADIDLDKLVEITEKYSGAELTAICNEAAFKALERDIHSTLVEMRDFEAAFKMVPPRTSHDTIKYFDSFSLNSGLHEI